ncbi:MAG: PEP-CTERM sorting domain-containing protein [Pirellulales bacterium]|nr:PEP-CTERM sorting domain-containing protein [Pirellulales bacterium]
MRTSATNAVALGLCVLCVCACQALRGEASEFFVRSLELGGPVENVDVVVTPYDDVAVGYGLPDGTVTLSWMRAGERLFDDLRDPAAGDAASFAADGFGNVFYASRGPGGEGIRVGQDFRGYGSLRSSLHPDSADFLVSVVPAMAVDRAGLPAVAGIDVSGARFLSRFDVPLAHWETERVGSFGLGLSPPPPAPNCQALTFDTAGHAALSYVQDTLGGLGPLVVAREDASGWANVADATALSVFGTSVAAPPDGSIGFLYVDDTGQLTFGAHSTGAADPIVISPLASHLTPRSLAYDTDGNPVVVYSEWSGGVDPPFGLLHLAHRDSQGQWTDQTLPVDSQRASVTFDSRGNPLIAAVTSSGVSLLAVTLSWDGSDSTWDHVAAGPPGDSHWDGGSSAAVPTAQTVAVINSGTCTVDRNAATWSLQIGETGAVHILADGDLCVADELAVAADATLALDGTAAAAATVAQGALIGQGKLVGDAQVEGVLAPGNGVGTFTVDGTLVLGDHATYACELYASGNDRLEVIGGGGVWLDGTLELRALGPVPPPEAAAEAPWGDSSCEIIAATEGASLNGAFLNFPRPGPDPPLPEQLVGQHLGYGVFTSDPDDDGQCLVYADDSVRLDVFQAAPGDTDGARFVNGLDIQAILAANKFGRNVDAEWTEGDFDGNGRVNGLDIQAILAANLFGSGPYAALACGGDDEMKDMEWALVGSIGMDPLAEWKVADTFQGTAGIRSVPIAVPEPGTVVMLAGLACGCLLGIAISRWRRAVLRRRRVESL